MSYKTNEIEISKNEDAAVILDFNIEDDYTDGTDLTYNASDTTAVATITLDKNYQGTFRIYKETDKKFVNVADTLTTAVNVPEVAGSATAAVWGASTAGAPGNGNSRLAASAPSNYDILANHTPGAGLGYIASDGTVTYKFSVNAGLDRGTKYVCVFDQNSKSEDNIGSGTENKFATAVEAPYLEAPVQATITKAAKNAPMEVTIQDADGATLTYMGMQQAIAGLASVGLKVADSGFYAATKTGAATTDATKGTLDTTFNVANSLKAGVYTSTEVVGGDAAFRFAVLVFNKGIYGKDEVKIRTSDAQVAYDAATSVGISYSKSKANDVKVTFGNLRADSTVYLVNLKDTAGKAASTSTVSDELPSVAFADVYADTNDERVVAYTTVSAGAADYTFTGVISGLNVGTGLGNERPGNSYIAVVIPEDETNYSPCYTGSTIAGGTGAGWTDATLAAVTGQTADITAQLTTYKIAGKGEFATGPSYGDAAAFDATADTALLGYDQFGNELTTAFTETKAGLDMTCVNPTVAAVPGTAVKITTAASANGGVTKYGIITIAAGGATTNKDEAWSIALSTGQTLTVTSKSNNGAGFAATTWKASLS